MSPVVEDRILNGYNNSIAQVRHQARVVEDRILNGYNNREVMLSLFLML